MSRIQRGALVFAARLSLAWALRDVVQPAAAELRVAQGSLPAGIAARVGSDGISTASLGRIAAAKGVPPPRAREMATRDALFASEARARGSINERT